MKIKDKSKQTILNGVYLKFKWQNKYPVDGVMIYDLVEKANSSWVGTYYLFCLVLGIIQQESNFDEKAIGVNKDDIGLMQINLKAFPDVSKKEMLNPELNVKKGISILVDHLRHYNFIAAAVSAYHVGHYDKKHYDANYAGKVILNFEEWCEYFRVGHYG